MTGCEIFFVGAIFYFFLRETSQSIKQNLHIEQLMAEMDTIKKLLDKQVRVP